MSISSCCERFFPGDPFVDGSVRGAMKAGPEAYSMLTDAPSTKLTPKKAKEKDNAPQT